jgi:hypothetical protein
VFLGAAIAAPNFNEELKMPSSLPSQVFLRSVVVGILVEPRLPDVAPYVYSSFVVEIRGRWFLFTAAHCAQQIQQALKHYRDGGIALLCYGDEEEARRIEWPRGKWTFIDFQRSLQRFRDVNPGCDLTRREADMFDIAVVPISDLDQCHLLNFGVRAVLETQAAYDELVLDQALSRNGPDNAMLIAGLPASRQSVDFGDKTIEMCFKSLPLHPKPDISRVDQDRTAEKHGNNFVWMPAAWTKQEWKGSIKGFSGGPEIIASGGEFYLMGLVAEEKKEGGEPTHAGICNLSGVIDVLIKAIDGDILFEVNTQTFE